MILAAHEVEPVDDLAKKKGSLGKEETYSIFAELPGFPKSAMSDIT